MKLFKLIGIITFTIVIIIGLYFGLRWYNLTLILNGNKIITLSYGEEYLDEGIEAYYGHKDISDKVICYNNINYHKLGKYYIEYSLEYNGIKKKVKREIVIIDNVAPVITLNGGKTVWLTYGSAYQDLGYTVKDNYDKNLEVTITGINAINNRVPGVYLINYEATDESGNTTKVTREVIVEERIVIKNGVTYVEGVLVVNKKYSLPSNYGTGVSNEAYNQLKKLQDKAKESGLTIKLISGYRSYDYQKNLYSNYVKKHGEAIANTFSAKPGHSEHQTGLAFDVGAIDDNYGKTKEGEWLAQNAHLYGFIIRYPKGKQSITGYKYEPWHIRYLGKDLATKVYQSGLCLEEYLNI